MMPIIKVENVSKRYSLGTSRASYGTLRESLVSALKSPFVGGKSGIAKDETIWALKDVSFAIEPGEVVGIIGRNGAGKSTLLKILARITEPTEGRLELFGRVGSLLEVGTGFHPELTGRENIYLNGVIMGMKREEIQRKFDEIVAFAEVSKFLDTPVKRYSSGMYVRLGFAVAAHFEPEILIVDEVLAVGDVRFQRKCLDKMKDVSRHGRTVLFVSHNMSAVTRLCERSILFDDGKLIQDGPSHEVVGMYLQSGLGTSASRKWADPAKAPGNGLARLLGVRVHTAENETADALDIRKPVGIEMEYEVLQSGHVMVPNYHFFNEGGVYAFVSGDNDASWRGRPRPAGRYQSTAWIPGNYLSEGTMIVGVALTTFETGTIHFYERDAVAFQVIDSLDGDSARGDFAGPIPGVVRPLLQWHTRELSDSERSVTVQAGEVA